MGMVMRFRMDEGDVTEMTVQLFLGTFLQNSLCVPFVLLPLLVISSILCMEWNVRLTCLGHTRVELQGAGRSLGPYRLHQRAHHTSPQLKSSNLLPNRAIPFYLV